VYARCDILLLDDPFSALDGKTENYIVENLFRAEGILKRMGTTVFFLTSSGKDIFTTETAACAHITQRRISIWQIT
jgi:ABC-type nitrate/sulfonate/bicarbonate transport system ATPase subunit